MKQCIRIISFLVVIKNNLVSITDMIVLTINVKITKVNKFMISNEYQWEFIQSNSFIATN